MIRVARSGVESGRRVLEGLADVQGVYEIVARELQRFRGAMTPTMTETLPESGQVSGPVAQSEVLDAILDEVRSIRKTMEAS